MRPNPQQTKPGLYLELLHGRLDPDQEMHGWGSQGPCIGPLESVHSTYNTTLRLFFKNKSDALRFFRETDLMDREVWLSFHDDLIAYDGVFYGDWSIEYRKEMRT